MEAITKIISYKQSELKPTIAENIPVNNCHLSVVCMLSNYINGITKYIDVLVNIRCLVL